MVLKIVVFWCDMPSWILHILDLGNGIKLFSHYRLKILSLPRPTISIWDLFSIKNPLYGFYYLNYENGWKITFIFYIYCTILLKIKICFIAHLLKSLLFLENNDVLSCKENDGNTNSRGWVRFFTIRQFWNIKIIILLLHKYDLLFCGMLKKYPIFLSDHWLISKRRVVAAAPRVVVACLPTLHIHMYVTQFIFSKVSSIQLCQRSIKAYFLKESRMAYFFFYSLMPYLSVAKKLFMFSIFPNLYSHIKQKGFMIRAILLDVVLKLIFFPRDYPFLRHIHTDIFNLQSSFNFHYHKVSFVSKPWIFSNHFI